MLSRARNFVTPAYLFACLVLGGSAQGIWQNMVLQLLGVAIIAWCAVAQAREPLAPAARTLLWIAIAAIAVICLQLIPLPASIWTHLGPRQNIAASLTALRLPLPAEPLSLDPARGLSALFGIIPMLAVFCSMVALKTYRPQWLAATLIAATMLGVTLGALQVATSGEELSPWYLYNDTNGGQGVGFFANVNHMASLLVITIPFLAATVAVARSRTRQRYSATIAIAAGVAVVLLIGVALNGSIAGYGLTLPVIAASSLVLMPQNGRWRSWILGVAALMVLASIVVLETVPIGSSKLGVNAESSVQSRGLLFATTSRAIADFMPFGSGLGSFRKVYPLYESADAVTTTYVVHVHNDYAELALELGIAGIVLMLIFLAWWAVVSARVWTSPEAGPFARAAAVASAAVLAHSVVDYPLRTAAIAACFGMCVALLADRRAAPPAESAELRRARHIEFR